MFSGIGGFSLGLQQAGIEPDWIGYSDIDSHANKVFKRRFPNAKELGSITDIQPRDLPNIDLVTFGFPCQDLSVAGKRGGLQANRSSLFFKAIDIVKAKKPKYFIFENVKGLFSSNGGKDFDIVLRSIADIGYDGGWQLLNTRWFLPQNRERIYFVGHIRGDRRPKVFPIGEGNGEIKNRLNQIGVIGKDSEATRVYDTTCARTIKNGGGMGAKTGLYRVEDVNLIAKKRKYDTPKEINVYLKKYRDKTIKEIAKDLDLPKTQVEHYFREDIYRAIPSPKVWIQLKNLLGFDDTYDKQVTEIYQKEYEFESSKRVYDARGIAQTIDTGKTGLYKVKPVLTPDRDKKRQNGRRFKENGEDMFTLTAQDRHGVQINSNIRRLTPTECERLQGFPDGWTDGQSDTQRYKQLGNAVSVPVVKAVMERLYDKDNIT